jgi:electron transfer flavoprotein alpha/beta subunit
MAIAHFPGRVHARCTTADDSVSRFALAAGAGRVSLIEGPESITESIVVVGPGALQDRGVIFAAQIAEANSAELVFDVLELTAVTAHSVVVRRGLGRGERDELEVSLPVVLVAHPQAEPRHYVSVYRQKFATLADLPNAASAKFDLRTADERPWGPVVPRPPSKAAGASSPFALADERANSAFGLARDESQSTGRGQPIQADAATCAAHLIRYLSHHGLLPPHLDGLTAAAPSPMVVAEIHPAAAEVAASIATAASAPNETRLPRLVGDEAWSRHQRHPRLLEAAASSGGLAGANQGNN